MPARSYFRSDTALALAPWILAAVACVLAFVLLAKFIDTLHMQMQRGQALRAGQSTTAVAQIGAQEHIAAASQNLAAIQP